MRSAALVALAAVAVLAGCSKPQPQEPRQRGMSAELRAQGKWGPPADLIAADGQKIGQVQTRKEPDGRWMVTVYSTLWSTPLPMGEHGLHIHEVGRCDPPDFASAGAHWNPAAKQHGHDNPAGWHLGDLGNLPVIGPPDQAYFETGTRPDGAARLDEGDPGTAPVVRDADGAAIIMHAQEDDEKTDPSGNTGDRIACAVIPPAQ